MPFHARPHLTTHNRNAKHSAVAAAAYRMGLKLFDRRTETWHDYRKRAMGEEVVAAKTIAPEWAPAWVQDPEELWNRVEAAERRKDAQIARDYVVPIPFGLDDQQAEELATRLAQYISDQLTTPVSFGVHRDAAVDAMGQVKPPEKQGFHAHLLFPTRKLLPPREVEEDEILDTAEIHGFGAKLSALSNRRASAGIVEMLNARWAALANELVAEQGLEATYEHRSYARLGIERTPQPNMGAAATAMERKGFFTQRGDAVREILVMSEVYRQAHQAALDAQQVVAQTDAKRPVAPSTLLVAPTGFTEPQRPVALPAPPATEDQAQPEAMPPLADPVEPSAAPEESPEVAWELAAARERGMQPAADLSDSFVASYPVLDDEEGRRTLFDLAKLVRAIHTSLRILTSLGEKLRAHGEKLRRFKTSQWQVETSLDEARRNRRSAKREAEDWAQKHHWRVLTAKVMASPGHVPARLGELQHQVEVQNRFVQDLKRSQTSMLRELEVLSAEGHVLKSRDARARKRLTASAHAFAALDEKAVPVLMGLLSLDQRVAFQEALPSADAQAPATPIHGEAALALHPPRPRP